MSEARTEARWNILKAVLQDVPDIVKENKLPVAFYAIGTFLIGLSQVALDASSHAGLHGLLFVATLFFLMGLLLVTLSIYDWVKPVSFWLVVAWLIGLQLIGGIIGVAFAIAASPLAIFAALAGNAELAAILTVPIVAIGLLFSSATVAYLTAYVITTSSLSLYLSKRVAKVVFVLAIAMTLAAIAEGVLLLLVAHVAPIAAMAVTSVGALVTAILMTLLIVAAVAAFKRYDPDLLKVQPAAVAPHDTFPTNTASPEPSPTKDTPSTTENNSNPATLTEDR